MYILLPDYISDEIDMKVANIIANHPQLAKDQDSIRSDFIKCFSDHGHIDMTVTPSTTT